MAEIRVCLREITKLLVLNIAREREDKFKLVIYLARVKEIIVTCT